jgi:hypothetical protein
MTGMGAAERGVSLSDLLASSRGALKGEVRILDQGKLELIIDPYSISNDFLFAMISERKITAAISIKVYRKIRNFIPVWKYSGSYYSERKAVFDPFTDEYSVDYGENAVLNFPSRKLFSALMEAIRTPAICKTQGQYKIFYRIDIRKFIPEPPLTVIGFFFPIGRFSTGWMQARITYEGGRK